MYNIVKFTTSIALNKRVITRYLYIRIIYYMKLLKCIIESSLCLKILFNRS